LTSENEALRAEIAGYRKSDPGGGGDAGGGEVKSDKGGVEEFEDEFRKLESQAG